MPNKNKTYKIVDGQEYEISVGYDLGGMNWFSGGVNKRGYYLYVTPCKTTDNGTYKSVQSILGQGIKLMLKEVSRASAKAEAESIELAKGREDELIKYCQDKYGKVSVK